MKSAMAPYSSSYNTSMVFDSLGRSAVQFGGRGGEVFPLAWSSPASPGQAPPLVLLLLPLADRWRDESHGTVRHSRLAPTPLPEQTHSPLVPPPLQPAQVPLLLLVGLLQLGQLDAVLHLHGIQPVHRHLAVELKEDRKTAGFVTVPVFVFCIF